jgi:hypothetical protein
MESGETALMIAASSGEWECVQLLVEAGTDRWLQDNNGQNALDRALAMLDIHESSAINMLQRATGKLFQSFGIDTGELAMENLHGARQVVDLLKYGGDKGPDPDESP